MADPRTAMTEESIEAALAPPFEGILAALSVPEPMRSRIPDGWACPHCEGPDLHAIICPKDPRAELVHRLDWIARVKSKIELALYATAQGAEWEFREVDDGTSWYLDGVAVAVARDSEMEVTGV